LVGDAKKKEKNPNREGCSGFAESHLTARFSPRAERMFSATSAI